ncbi:hypothetical protein [Sphingopyxis sp.]|uniref:hypothetical protein n=1 Tax=Sphingopyxis sp. TaxID=1908224 RepID=UPI003D0DAEA5
MRSAVLLHDGVCTIETRILLAYMLIGLLIAAGVAAVFWARYNSRDRKIQRQRDRESAQRDERLSELPPTL